MDIFDNKGIKPMLISEMVDPYDDPDSLFELKLDGMRCIAYIDNNSVDLRNKRDFKLLSRFPELSKINGNCNGKCILDGELITAINGKPSFYHVQSRSTMSNAAKILLESKLHPACFVAYDILYLNGKALVDTPLIERKKILSNTVNDSSFLATSRHIEGAGIQLFELAKAQELEGIVGKKKESLYWYGKRTKEWNKVKWLIDDDFVVSGFIPKENNMTSLVLAKYSRQGELVLLNHVTLGVTIRKLKENHMEYSSSCPFEDLPPGHENAIWIKPMVCTVSYMPDKNTNMRQAVLKSIRIDKEPSECVIDK